MSNEDVGARSLNQYLFRQSGLADHDLLVWAMLKLAGTPRGEEGEKT